MKKRGVKFLVNSILSKAKKRGLSTVILSVIMVGITLIAIAIVWTVINGIISKQTDTISLESLTLNFELTKVGINTSSNNVTLTISRKQGEGEQERNLFLTTEQQQK